MHFLCIMAGCVWEASDVESVLFAYIYTLKRLVFLFSLNAHSQLGNKTKEEKKRKQRRLVKISFAKATQLPSPTDVIKSFN